MTETIDHPGLKTKHRRMWASGDYPAVASEVIPRLGERVVRAAGIEAGDRVLDVGAGSGNAAIPAAELGADVIASDLTPELFDAGRREAAERGVELRWEQGDAEALPYADNSFDAVISCVGVMFAPFHQAAADELVRVTRPGGTIANLSWTPSGFIGELFRTMKPFAPPPPPGASPAPLWGDEAHVRELLGDGVTDVSAVVEEARIDRFASGAEFRDFFKATYGPTIAAYAFLGEDAGRVAELDEALAELGDGAMRADGTMGWEYLLVTARKA